MNEKTTSLLLICLVALSIIYACNSSTTLSSHIKRSVDGVRSRSPTPSEETCQNGKLTYPGPHPGIMGDPVDDVRTH
jgi:hypothetical protein